MPRFEQFLRFPDADSSEILVRRFPVDLFEQTDKMEFRKIRFVRNVAEVDLSCIPRVDEELGLDDAAVERLASLPLRGGELRI